MFEIELIICIKMDLALNNLQSFIWHKTQPTNLYMYKEDLTLNNVQTLICDKTQTNNQFNEESSPAQNHTV